MGGGRFLMMAPDRMFAGLDLFPFLAMPFFILAGEIMNRSGITTSLVQFAAALVGWMRGGMAHSNMLASVMFAGITGAATADAAAFGNTLVPAMVKQGYTKPFACAVTAAGSIIGPTIPPSTLMVIYGSIIATPTEAASIAVFYALVVGGLLYRRLTFRDLYEMCVRTVRITGVIFLIIASASILGWWMTFNQIPQAVAESFFLLSDDPRVIIGLIIALLLFIGLFMDINATLIILAPVLAPLTLKIGMDPVHAGIMIILALNISLMTPPVGACLFVLASVTKEKIENITRSLWPFLVAEVIVLFVVAYWADMTLAVPRLLGL
jgi:TRAP-type C4-dicarboxylate transport system permease large subunit